MDTPARSLKGKTLGSSSATCVARSAQKGVIRLSMWRQFTFQEVTSISVTNVMRSLTPTTNGSIIAQECTPTRSRSECWCELHNENFMFSKKESNNLPLIQRKLNNKHFVKAQIGFLSQICEKNILHFQLIV